MQPVQQVVPTHCPPGQAPGVAAWPQLPPLHESVVQGLVSAQLSHEPYDPHCDTLVPDTQVEPLQHSVDEQHSMPQQKELPGQASPGLHRAC
jgi:hypothetical protein